MSSCVVWPPAWPPFDAVHEAGFMTEQNIISATTEKGFTHSLSQQRKWQLLFGGRNDDTVATDTSGERQRRNESTWVSVAAAIAFVVSTALASMPTSPSAWAVSAGSVLISCPSEYLHTMGPVAHSVTGKASGQLLGTEINVRERDRARETIAVAGAYWWYWYVCERERKRTESRDFWWRHTQARGIQSRTLCVAVLQ